MRNVIWAIVICFIGLAFGSILWLDFFRDAHLFRRSLSQEQRHAEIVRAAPLPKPPIVLTIRPRRDGCISITRAEISDSSLWVYLTNACHTAQSFVAVHWKAYAPDGTIVVSDHEYVGDASGGLEAGDKEEFHTDSMKGDPRIVSIDLYATSQDRN